MSRLSASVFDDRSIESNRIELILARTEYAKTLPTQGTPRGHNVGSHAFVRTADSDVVFDPKRAVGAL